MWVSVEQSAGKPNLIHQQQSKGEAEESGHQPQPHAEVSMFSSKEGEGRRDAHGNQHHAGNGPNSENQQVRNGPAWIANRGENQQGYGSRASQTVHDTNEKRPQLPIDSDLAEEPIHPRYRRFVRSVRMRFRRVRVRVRVDVIAMAVWMRVHRGHGALDFGY